MWKQLTLVLRFAGVQLLHRQLLPDAKHFSVVDKSAFAIILYELHGHIHSCQVQAP